MIWHSITLQQFQDIHKLTLDTGLDELERSSRAICILYNLTEQQVDDMLLPKFNELSKEVSQFLDVKEIPGKPVKSFMVGANKYAINYNPTTLKHRQYVEIVTFSQNTIENMHNIMASLVNPVRFGFKRANKVEHHSKYAEDMLNAPFLAVYHSCIFFCKVYRNLITHIQDYLITEIMSKGIAKMQAENLIAISIKSMDGFLAPGKLQITNVSL